MTLERLCDATIVRSTVSQLFSSATKRTLVYVKLNRRYRISSSLVVNRVDPLKGGYNLALEKILPKTHYTKRLEQKPMAD
jgi:hypothetical protein